MAQERIMLPLLPMRDPDIVIFPHQFGEIDVGRPFSLKAIERAKNNGNKIIIAMQKDENVDDPKAKDFYSICSEAEIKHITPMKNEDGSVMARVNVMGTRRAWLKVVGTDAESESSYLYGEIDIIKEPSFSVDDHISNSIRQLKEMVTENTPITPDENTPITSEGLSAFLDSIASQLPIVGRQKLKLLRIKDPRKRLEELLTIMAELTKQTPVSIDAEPSGSDGSIASELMRLQKMIEGANLPSEALSLANQELRRLKMMSPHSSEFHVTLNYVEWLASLPWNVVTDDSLDIEKAQVCLDEDHFGLKTVKERIIEFLAVRKLSSGKMGTILCFTGSPGVGKTSICRSIARAVGRKFVRISLGGVHDEAEIRGHRRTYVGALPGKIIQNIRKVGSRNPVFVLDEIDKLSKDFRGDPASALLEVLDPEQNNSFTDNFLGTAFDLSDVMFIMTANETSPIPPALYDRMEIIEIPGYSPFDKVKIAQKHLIPKQKEQYGLKDYEVSISPNAISRIVEEYTSEAGVRNLERQCGTIMRKVAVTAASGKDPAKVVKVDMVPKFLGAPKIYAERAIENPEVGLSAGLAWSRNGGSILFVEASLTPGKGEIILTGNLGKVLQESAKAAHTWIKSNADNLGVDLEQLSKNDVHVHLPAGATPKDGPSAGIAVAAAMLSLFTNRPVRNNIAMTGEITLRGRVLPIGGLKEKVLAAHRAGIQEVIYPKQNVADIEEIPSDVKDDMKFIPVGSLNEALELLLVDDSPKSAGDISSSGGNHLLMNKENSCA